MNKIIMIGAGHMATQLVLSFYKEGHPIAQVYNRTYTNATHLESYITGEIVSTFDQIDKQANLYIISVADRAIQVIADELFDQIQSKHAIIVHTAGNMSINALDHVRFKNVGVFYPLQSVRKERPVNLRAVPILLNTTNSYTYQELSYYAHIISDQVHTTTDAERKKLHLPAVMVNNLVNHIYTLTKEYCNQENLPFHYLNELIKETSDRITSGSDPQDVQTGPAIRSDENTINRHISLLSEHPEMREVYQLISKQIMKKYNT